MKVIKLVLFNVNVYESLECIFSQKQQQLAMKRATDILCEEVF